MRSQRERYVVRGGGSHHGAHIIKEVTRALLFGFKSPKKGPKKKPRIIVRPFVVLVADG